MAIDIQALVLHVLQASIVTVVFSYGLVTTPEDLMDVVRVPSRLVRAIIAVFFIMPLVAYLIGQWLPLTVGIALVALSISPIPPLLPRRMRESGGAGNFGLGLLVVLACVSLFTVPLSLAVLARFTEFDLAMPVSKVFLMVAMTVLVPVAAGMAVRAWAPAVAKRIARPMSVFGFGLLAVLGTALAVKVAPAIWELVGNGAVLGMAAFILVGLAIGHYVGGPSQRYAEDVALAAACRHPAIAMAIASANFPDRKFGAAILLFLILSIVLATPYLLWLKRRAAQG